VLEVVETESYVVGMSTRLPFSYGIAQMTVVPHVVVRARLEIQGRTAVGLAADHLPPKWFTKDPATTYEQDLPALVETVLGACRRAPAVGPQRSPFDFWMVLDAEQREWGRATATPALLAAFGATLLERAVIDGWCRLRGLTFAAAAQRAELGIDPARLHPELEAADVANVLRPATSVKVRHTVGLGDPLTEDEVSQRPGDGLPVAVAEVLRRYGVNHLKVKLSGDVDVDVPRLGRILELAPTSVSLTVDGNENFRSVHAFREAWERMDGDVRLGPRLREALIVVEQPLHRSVALEPDVGRELAGWRVAPPLVIDESDAERDSLRRALDLGYAGGTFKSCKGVMKGLVNAALIQHRSVGGQAHHMTAEDLATVPPISLLQDLAVVSALGMTHVERNAHHYFHGPAPLSVGVSRQLVGDHPDLFHLDGSGAALLKIEQGSVQLGSVASAPFGYSTAPVLDGMEPLSLEAALKTIAANP
jgi:hypothetical protein